ncbi:hypothetical protein [Kitasatospora sp. NPDC002965]|uniref:hypothetical protein n=1 Tax=Kitasatospora sp. NPDC002965 TaxID=3154775 RepID=UPI0033AF3BBB
MTDRLPRRPGGGDDGPDETPVERLLREAMSARAAQIGAHDLRPAAPPNRRVRRLRPVYLAAVPLFALAAALAFGVLGFRGDTVARQQDPGPAATVTVTETPSPVPTPVPTPEPSPTAAPTADASPSADADEAAGPGDRPTGGATGAPLGGQVPQSTSGGTPPVTSTSSSSAPPQTAAVPYTFRGVKFKVPPGWRVSPPKPTDDRVCVLSPGAPTSAQPGWSPDSCEPYGVSVVVYDSASEVEGATWPTTADLGSTSGWGHQPTCPIWGRPYIPTGPYASVGAPVRTKDIVAGRAIDKTQWQVACTSADTFTAQLWGLSADQVFIVANGLKPEYQAGLVSLLDTLNVSGHPAPVQVPHQNDVSVSVEGIGVGQQVPNDGSAVPVTVTYKNTSQTDYAAMVPFVYAEPYPGAPAAGAGSAVRGTVERQDGAGAWQTYDIGITKPARDGSNGIVALAPGQSVTLKFRLKLTPQDGAGVMPVTFTAMVVPQQGPGSVVGTRTIPVRVVVK